MFESTFFPVPCLNKDFDVHWMHYPNQTGVPTYREAFGKIDFVYVVEPYDGKRSNYYSSYFQMGAAQCSLVKSRIIWLFFLFPDGRCTMLPSQELDLLMWNKCFIIVCTVLRCGWATYLWVVLGVEGTLYPQLVIIVKVVNIFPTDVLVGVFSLSGLCNWHITADL
jgi:hypothetical protein